MVVSKNYKIKEQNGMYYIVPSSVPGCPQCGGEMKIRDSKRRKVIFADGTVDTFVLRRYKCTVCGRVHLELPDIMVPHTALKLHFQQMLHIRSHLPLHAGFHEPQYCPQN